MAQKKSTTKKNIKSIKLKKGGVLPYKPLDVVSVALKFLSERDADIISRRHGFATGRRETLEEIGKTYELTRERIRQVENSVINKLRGLEELRDALDDIGVALQRILTENGHAMEDSHFMDTIFKNERKPDLIDRHAITFLAKHLLVDHVAHVKETDTTLQGWKHVKAPWELFEKTISTVKTIFDDSKEPIAYGELMDRLKKTDFYKEYKDMLAEQHVLSYMKLSQSLHHNAYQEWGMADWSTIKPKRMSDKIYIVLKKEQKPLHFEQITERINTAGFSGKQAYKATVHNELILDNRFVLVGRGLYGLTEWGFKPGVVADVIEAVMKETGRPLTKDEIVEKVLEQRIVKPATVNLALMNKKRFKKVAPKTYYVA